MNKTDLAESLSVSCVENYFVAWLKNYADVRQFYVKSFVSFSALAADFLNKCARYENYYGVNRIQDLTEEWGLTSHKKYSGKFRLDLFDEKKLVLMKVNRMFFDNYLRNPWREDHYIAIEKKETEYKLLNNYPIDLKIEREESVKSYCGGEFLVYECVDCFYSIKQIPEFSINDDLDINTFANREEKLIAIIGLYKVFYKRMIQYFEWLCVPNSLDGFIAEINIFHITLEKMRIKGKYDFQFIAGKIAAIIENEKQILRVIKEGVNNNPFLN